MIENQAQFNYEDLSSLFGMENLFNINDNFFNNRVVTDSREIKSGDIFVALVGENIDAHTKTYDAYKNGAIAILVNKSWFTAQRQIFIDENSSDLAEFDKIPFVLVNNTLDALGSLAHHHRNRFKIPIVAVAGSNGKTTTKEMITKVLSKKYKVLSTYKNFNNQIGVPLMLLSLNESYTAAVIEIATNSHGEIFKLANILAPKYGVITNIGKEHLEILEDLDGVEMEETSLFAYLRKHLGFAFINADDKRLLKYSSLLENKMVYGTNEVSEVKATFNFDDNLLPKIDIDLSGDHFSYKLQEIGLGNAYASLVAFGVGVRLEVDTNDIIAALEEFTTDKASNYGRMRIENYITSNGGKITIINDCYNANPSSMELAINTVDIIRSNYTTTIGVIGEMRELGDAAPNEHKELLDLATNKIQNLLIYGKEFEKIELANYPKIKYFEDKTLLNSIVEELINSIKSGDKVLLLVKGSRGNKLEEVINYLHNSKILN